MEKIKVGFLLNNNENWLGGVNYYRNLISIITSYKDLNIEPIIFVSQDVNMSLFKDYEGISIIRTGFLTRWHFLWFIRKVLCKLIDRDIILEKILNKNNIDVLSHIQTNLRRIKLPTLAWIPDFQHKYLSALFSEHEIKDRDESFLYLAKNYDTVILSSNDAKKDFIKFFPAFKNKAEVLQFVVEIKDIVQSNSRNYLKEKYAINSKFFYLPNQYWEHKNHKVVLQALCILKKEKKNILIVSTGNKEDYRNKEYFFTLDKYIKEEGLVENFYALGTVEYKDVQVLANECTALINPSLFEGWSTTVEEAKSMGKKMILSNINVHKEQKPDGGIFFDPYNANELAEKMWLVWNEPQADGQLQILAKNNMERRKRQFAETYKNIIAKTIEKYNKN